MKRVRKQACEEAASRIVSWMLKGQPGDWGMDIDSWDWNPGVGIIAILEYYECSQKPEVLSDLIKWTERNRHQSDKHKVINSMAPFTIYPRLYELTGNPYYLNKAIEIGDWMLKEAPKTREGAFEHTVTEPEAFSEQVWADTIFMAVLFLARLARVTANNKYGEEALVQLRLHFKLLQDEKTGVLFHGWDCGRSNHMSAARWGRANAWIALATPMILQDLRGMLNVPELLMERYLRLLRGLKTYQSDNGLWPVVVDRPDYRCEVSGSVGIACSFIKAANQGWVDAEYRAAANLTLEQLLDSIDDNGHVGGVSGGTPVLPSEEAYDAFEIRSTQYGQGLALFLLTEYLNS
ncbi:glycoside hydrolase family 88/105 protein [Paenibacillus sedimenti]|uniref:Glycoside hydrolase family 88 protein n=1 Tax=Paenibacillus sedimenti TaxID=2770274 RepID=A0A926KPV3_9BACL|nr:glycoside hydrolase family 88 protein [Paenibacillus sedimenti]MBD0379925.1 glycoside hydrolase family 88 protein [Paenibacillus sedimenti]